MAWLRDLAWPVKTAIFDGEAVAGDGLIAAEAQWRSRPSRGRLLGSCFAGVERADHGAWMGKVCSTFPRRGSTRALRSVSSWHAARNASMARTISLTNDAIPMTTRCG
jgi:hypothetical protein